MTSPNEAKAWDYFGMPEWDDRKVLLELWQEHAPLPDIGLREGIFDALLAVANWGYGRGREANDPNSELNRGV